MIDETNLNMAIEMAKRLNSHLWSSEKAGPREWNAAIFVLEFLKSLKGENNDSQSNPSNS